MRGFGTHDLCQDVVDEVIVVGLYLRVISLLQEHFGNFVSIYLIIIAFFLFDLSTLTA